MLQHFNTSEADFLTPSEDNFPALLAKIDFLHNQILRQAVTNVPRTPLKRYSYTDQSFTVPHESSTSDEVLSELAQAFRGSVRWHQPTALMNITPNPLLDTVAATSLASLYNVNALWDYASGNVITYEKEVLHFLSYLAGWNPKEADGFSTSGGKATIMYAIKCGLNNCDRQTVDDGLRNRYVVIAGATSHYSIEDCSNYLGLGRANVIRVPVDGTGSMDPAAFEHTLREVIDSGKRVAAIIALGGDTLEHAVDPIKRIHEIRVAVAREQNLDYLPYLHLDSVNAWIALTFRDYDFSQNPLNLEGESKHRVSTLYQKMSEVRWADSFSADFHKTGLAPYVSSFFIARDGRHVHSIHKRHALTAAPSYLFGETHTHHVSFENSRSAGGILSAWTSMKRMGIAGYRHYWSRLVVQGTYIRTLISQRYEKEITVLNTTALGHPNVILPIPAGLSISYNVLLSDETRRQSYSQYCFELYEFMAYRLLSENSPYPLLGFVPNYKYEMTGIKCPAFLLYLNHPNTSKQACDTLLQQIIQMKHDFEQYRRTTPPKNRPTIIERLPK